MRLRWSSFTPYSPRDDLGIILRQPCCYARCWPWLTLMILKAISTPGHNIKGAFAEVLTSLDRVFCCSVVCAFDARLAQPITILNGLAAQASLNASWRQNPSSDLQLDRNRYNQPLSGHCKNLFSPGYEARSCFASSALLERSATNTVLPHACAAKKAARRGQLIATERRIRKKKDLAKRAGLEKVRTGCPRVLKAHKSQSNRGRP